ncbi:MAG TPA: hypothetical protein PKI62_10320 [bacterium]|nr:hypothetical protein [bacterium]HPR87433.1 hypothetical protein [bacterium]
MPHTYEELRSKTITDLREIAKGLDHEAVQGYTQLNKEHLLIAVCKALGVEMHAHHQHHEAAEALARMKKEVKSLKKERDAALTAHDRTALKRTRTKMRRLKKRISQA